jgi:holliday junction resolvase Hjr
MSKAKGSRLERELLRLFWEDRWFCTRMAGSGSMPLPCPDLLAGKKGRVLALECKGGKGDKRRYITKEQIEELKEFSKGFGAEAWVAVRFDGLPWAFLEIKHLGKGNNYHVDRKLAEKKGISFSSLISRK